MSLLDSIVNGLGAVTGLGSVAANLVSNASNVKLAREQREHDLRMWNLNNEYNKPAAQVRRLRDAGLNPGLSMMNGLMSSGTSSQTAGGQTSATVDYNPLAQGLRDTAQFFSDKRKTEAEVRNLEANSQAVNIRNKTQMVRDLAELNKTIASTGESSAHKVFLIKQAELLAKQISAFDQKNTADLKKIDAETRLINQQEETERVMRGVNEQLVAAQVRLSKTQQHKLNADIKYILESVEQMKLNGASQREINSFIRDKEREIARQYNLENTNWYTTYKTRIARERSETRKANTSSLFGIPFDLESSWKLGESYLP